jgi:TolA-binding protein
MRALALAALAAGMGARAAADGATAKATLDGADALFAQRKYEKAAVVYLQVTQDAGTDAASVESARLGAIQCLRKEGAFDAFRSTGEAFLKARSATAAETDAIRQLKLTLAESWFEQGNYATATAKLGDYVAAHKADVQSSDTSATQKLFGAVSKRAVALDRSGAGGGRALLLEYAAKFSDPELAGRLKIYAAGFLRDAGDVAGFKRELAAITKGNWSASSRPAFDAQWELARAAADEDNLTSAAMIVGNYIYKYPNSKWAFRAAAQRDHWLVRARRYAEARAAMLGFAAKHKGTADGVEAGFRAAQGLFNMENYSEFQAEAAGLLRDNPDFCGPTRDMFDYQMCVASIMRHDWAEAANRLEIFVADHPGFRKMDEAKVCLGDARMRMAQQYANADNATSATVMEAQGRAILKEMILKLNADVTSKTRSLSPLRTMILDAYYYSRDYDGLAAEAQKLTDEQTTHSPLWVKATFWHGVALAVKSPPDLDGAAADLDAVLDSGIVDGNLKEHIPSRAAIWRVTVAGGQNDKRALAALKPKIDALPECALKARALARWQAALAATN